MEALSTIENLYRFFQPQKIRNFVAENSDKYIPNGVSSDIWFNAVDKLFFDFLKGNKKNGGRGAQSRVSQLAQAITQNDYKKIAEIIANTAGSAIRDEKTRFGFVMQNFDSDFFEEEIEEEYQTLKSQSRAAAMKRIGAKSTTNEYQNLVKEGKIKAQKNGQLTMFADVISQKVLENTHKNITKNKPKRS